MGTRGTGVSGTELPKEKGTANTRATPDSERHRIKARKGISTRVLWGDLLPGPGNDGPEAQAPRGNAGGVGGLG